MTRLTLSRVSFLHIFVLLRISKATPSSSGRICPFSPYTLVQTPMLCRQNRRTRSFTSILTVRALTSELWQIRRKGTFVLTSTGLNFVFSEVRKQWGNRHVERMRRSVVQYVMFNPFCVMRNDGAKSLSLYILLRLTSSYNKMQCI